MIERGKDVVILTGDSGKEDGEYKLEGIFLLLRVLK